MKFFLSVSWGKRGEEGGEISVSDGQGRSVKVVVMASQVLQTRKKFAKSFRIS